MKAVFTSKVEPTYDDLREKRYHFPRTYLGAVEKAVGDWIVYYEPRRSSGDPSSRGGRQAYFAVARLTSIEPDPVRSDHYYALLSDYLDFVRAVGFQENEHYYEAGLQRSDGATSKGAFGRAVRIIPDEEYDLIFQAGFGQVLEEPTNAGLAMPGFAQEPATFDRPVIERLIARPFRDRAFSNLVKSAYEDTCAMTGLKIINGGGRSEVQAAHIRPVADQGPDSVRNGLALCGTLHWMFDRGLVSIDDDYSLLVAEDRLPDTMGRLINENRRLRQPFRPDWAPHPQFLNYHRTQVFKG